MFVTKFCGKPVEISDRIVTDYSLGSSGALIFNHYSEKAINYNCAFTPTKVQKFPATIESKATLRKVLTTLMWAFTGRHAATTYPILEYGGFLPNAPHRMFADKDGNEVFSNLMFGNKAVALVRRQIFS